MIRTGFTVPATETIKIFHMYIFLLVVGEKLYLTGKFIKVMTSEKEHFKFEYKFFCKNCILS